MGTANHRAGVLPVARSPPRALRIFYVGWNHGSRRTGASGSPGTQPLGQVHTPERTVGIVRGPGQAQTILAETGRRADLKLLDNGTLFQSVLVEVSIQVGLGIDRSGQRRHPPGNDQA